MHAAFSLVHSLTTHPQARKLDQTLVNFFMSCLGGVLWFFLITAVIDVIGLPILNMAAMVAALGLAVGFAVGGVMSNFVAGIMILARKPFKVGDYIEAQGVQGSVNKVCRTTGGVGVAVQPLTQRYQIDMFMTTLLSPDNKTITVPNQPLATETLINYSEEKKRRVDLIVGVAYKSDLAKTRKILVKLAKTHSKVLKEPATVVNVHELADSSVNFVLRPWVKTADYWSVYWDLHAQVKVALDNVRGVLLFVWLAACCLRTDDCCAQAGIGIPFPQRDIHIVDDQVEEVSDNESEYISEGEEVEPDMTEESLDLGSKIGSKVLGGIKKIGSGILSKKGSKSKKGETPKEEEETPKEEAKEEEADAPTKTKSKSKKSKSKTK